MADWIFKKGDEVVQILSLAGVETACLGTVISVKKGVATVEDCSFRFCAKTGRCLDGEPVRLVVLE
jgi:hypothetical protein